MEPLASCLEALSLFCRLSRNDVTVARKLQRNGLKQNWAAWTHHTDRQKARCCPRRHTTVGYTSMFNVSMTSPRIDTASGWQTSLFAAPNEPGTCRFWSSRYCFNLRYCAAVTFPTLRWVRCSGVVSPFRCLYLCNLLIQRPNNHNYPLHPLTFLHPFHFLWQVRGMRCPSNCRSLSSSDRCRIHESLASFNRVPLQWHTFIFSLPYHLALPSWCWW